MEVKSITDKYIFYENGETARIEREELTRIYNHYKGIHNTLTAALPGMNVIHDDFVRKMKIEHAEMQRCKTVWDKNSDFISKWDMEKHKRYADEYKQNADGAAAVIDSVYKMIEQARKIETQAHRIIIEKGW